ncbi:hypothetical protein SAMN05444062_10410 [Pseudomonas syringae]|nr:hypothetical protein SAMN05444062_10410 [Pseudomonas syringae]
MDFLRQEYSLREQVRSYGSTRYLVGVSLPAKRPVQSMDFLRQKYRIREQVPTGARGTLWERACSRRVRCSRWTFCVRNTAFANKADREHVRSYGSTRYLVGASLLAKRPVQLMDFLRQEYRLREQVRSYRSTRCPVGADLSAKRAVHSMHWLRLEYSLREQVRSYRSTRYLVGACSRRVRCSRWTFCVRNTAFANKFAPTGVRGAL